MKLKLKVCGMRDPLNILEVASLKPDYIGFIYYKGSPRYVGENFEAPVIRKKTQRVGVFVNHPLSFVFQEVERNSLYAVQLHGHETPEFCSNIKSRGLTVIKSFAVDRDFDFADTKPYQYSTDFFLFDTMGRNYGGTGRVFDWSLLKNYTSPTPFFLSGGLSEENVSQIATIKNPSLYAIDLNSGVEDSPGVKSKKRIENIIQQLSEIKLI